VCLLPSITRQRKGARTPLRLRMPLSGGMVAPLSGGMVGTQWGSEGRHHQYAGTQWGPEWRYSFVSISSKSLVPPNRSRPQASIDACGRVLPRVGWARVLRRRHRPELGRSTHMQLMPPGGHLDLSQGGAVEARLRWMPGGPSSHHRSRDGLRQRRHASSIAPVWILGSA
jgi:hypothetical protein